MNVAVIFDMDGVITDNAEFHKKAWKKFCASYGIPFNDEIFNTLFFGKTNLQVLPILFGKKLTPAEIGRFSEQKEIIFREIFQPEMKPVAGLVPFLEELHTSNIDIALATSAPPENIEMILGGLGIKKYFKVIVDDTMVSQGKPNPEVYLKASLLLGKKPSECVVFEDSLSGTQAAFDAGNIVVALTTSILASEHKYYHHIISDFREISVNFILQILFKNSV